MAPKVFLVTGTSTGFGRALVENILAQGNIAVATLRKPQVLDELTKKYNKDQLLVLPLDVTKKEQVVAAFAKVKEVFGRLDVVISNAGAGTFGEVEFTPDDAARSMFEINFWGHLEVVKQSLAFFRDVNEPGKGGRLLSVSSIVGLSSYPGNGIYCASKHALEGAMEAIYKELDPAWNIKLTNIEPGMFKTPGFEGLTFIPVPAPYNNPSLPSVQLRENIKQMGEAYGADPNKGAKVMLKVAEMEDPPFRLLLGQDALQGAKAQMEGILEGLEKYRDLSSDLAFDKPVNGSE